MQGNCGRMMMLLMFVMFSKKQSMKRGRVQKKYGNFLWHLPLSVRPTPSPPSPLLMALISILFSPHFFSFAIESYLYETDFTLGPIKLFVLKSYNIHLVPIKNIVFKSYNWFKY